MIAPSIITWVVKSDQPILSRCDRRDIAAFISVAGDTGQRQIIDFRCTAMLTTNNVLDLKSEIRVLFGDQTVLANVIGSSGNNQSSFRRDVASHSARNRGLVLSPAASGVRVVSNDRARTFLRLTRSLPFRVRVNFRDALGPHPRGESQ